MEEIRLKMNKALELLANELATLKTGRADPALVERIIVEAYETKMPVVELATITVVSPNQLVITPFDPSVIKNIERALALDRDLGLTAVVSENVVRVNIPSLTEERRREFVKILHQKLEAARVIIRQIRHDKMIQLKRSAEAKQINEDEKFSQENELQKMTDEFVGKIEEMGEAKEGELLGQ